MIAVIFEAEPKPGMENDYFSKAEFLKQYLTGLEGFISIERFACLSNPSKFLSLSFWESEEAITAWRENVDHRRAQKAGRENIFRDYRLRIAAVVRDYGLSDRLQAPKS